MTDITNETRAERAENALHDYTTSKGEVFENCLDEVADLVADLLHLEARMAREDGAPSDDYVERVMRLARLHFDAEHENPEETGELARAP